MNTQSTPILIFRRGLRGLAVGGLCALAACQSADERSQQEAARLAKQQQDVTALYEAATSMADLDAMRPAVRAADASTTPQGTRSVKVKVMESDFATVYLAQIENVYRVAEARRSWVVQQLAVLSRNQPRGNLIVSQILRDLDNRALGIRKTPSAVLQDFQTIKYLAQ